MIMSLLLVGYGLLFATVGAVALRRAAWVTSAPRGGVVAWVSLGVASLGPLLLAGLMMVHSSAQASPWSWLWMAFSQPRQIAAGESLPLLLCSVLLIFSAGVIVAGAVAVWRHLHRSRTASERLRVTVRAVGQEHPTIDGLWVVPDDRRASVYCLAGREPAIVITAAALESLNPAELVAVVAHERAHITGRHHAIFAIADALRDCFGILPVFRIGRAEIQRLLELAADDVAVRRTDRYTVARAMLAVAGGYVPHTAVGASGSQPVARIERLVTSPDQRRQPRATLTVVGLAMFGMLPWAVAGIERLAATHVMACMWHG